MNSIFKYSSVIFLYVDYGSNLQNPYGTYNQYPYYGSSAYGTGQYGGLYGSSQYGNLGSQYGTLGSQYGLYGLGNSV